MRIAFTIDDLPMWSQSYPPAGYTAEGIVDSIRSALRENGIFGVYAFATSWSLKDHPEYAKILDNWVADGHHVANHTHSHFDLPDVTAEAFIADIDTAERHLSPWLSKAPLKLFRYPTCYWGETSEKLQAVKSHLKSLGLTPVDVTSWPYEWTWNQAYRNALDANDEDALKFVKSSFLDFSAAQIRHDMAAAEDWFGEEIIGITVAHNVPFFADVVSDYIARLKQDGAVFVPLGKALTGPVQKAVGSVVSGDFLVLQQKLAASAGRPLAQFPESQVEIYTRIVEMAKGQNG